MTTTASVRSANPKTRTKGLLVASLTVTGSPSPYGSQAPCDGSDAVDARSAALPGPLRERVLFMSSSPPREHALGARPDHVELLLSDHAHADQDQSSKQERDPDAEDGKADRGLGRGVIEVPARARRQEVD